MKYFCLHAVNQNSLGCKAIGSKHQDQQWAITRSQQNWNHVLYKDDHESMDTTLRTMWWGSNTILWLHVDLTHPISSFHTDLMTEAFLNGEGSTGVYPIPMGEHMSWSWVLMFYFQFYCETMPVCLVLLFSFSCVFFLFITSPVLFRPHSPHLYLIPLLVCLCI